MDPEKYKDLKFEIAFARKDYDGCRKILEDVKLLTAAIANAGIKWRATCDGTLHGTGHRGENVLSSV